MQNFDLSIQHYDPTSRALTLAVTGSPAGEAGPQTVTVPGIGLADALAAGSFRNLARLGSHFTQGVMPARFWALWRESLGRSGGSGLRLRIRGAGPANALPWELLYDGERRRFLAQDAATPVVRYLEGPIPAADAPPPRPLALLLASAAPRDLEAIDVSGELKQIEQALASPLQAGDLRIRRADHLQARQVHPLLSEHRPQILHFAGHGVYDSIGEQGSLALEGEGGEVDLLEAEALAVLLQAAALRLVTLSACESGVGAEAADGNPWSGVAHGLVLAGIPAVVAMGAALSDASAAAWASHFYAAVARGRPVDLAVTAARQAMMGERGAGVLPGEWLVPVLFMRADDGRLWQEPQEEHVTGGAPGGGIQVGTINAVNVAMGDQTIHMPNATFHFGRQAEETDMTLNEVRTDLRRLLADLYPDMASARIVVDSAGLQQSRITFSGAANSTWHSILQEAENSWLIGRLLDAVLRDYPENRQLANTVSRYRLASPMFSDKEPRSATSNRTEGARQEAGPEQRAAGDRQAEAQSDEAPPPVRTASESSGAGQRSIEIPSIHLPHTPIEFDWVPVPAGEFLMGSDPARDSDAYGYEQPQHTLYLPEFHISRTPVTNDQFGQFIRASGGYVTTAEERGASLVWTGSEWREEKGAFWAAPKGPGSTVHNRGDHPVVHVSWNDAVAYCQWAGVQLPTEAQWEKAARGAHGRIYPWGNQPPTSNRCNFDMTIGDTTPVGRYPDGESPYGCLDMAGNVWEWTQTKWRDNYTAYAETADNSPEGAESRVVRGGSFNRSRVNVRCAVRNYDFPINRRSGLGFRVLSPGR